MNTQLSSFALNCSVGPDILTETQPSSVVITEARTQQSPLVMFVVSFISLGIVGSNVINLVILSRIRQMAWATRAFLINLSISDLGVGLVACAPAVYATAVGYWPYGDAWCQISGIMHGTSVTISIWSISMVGVERFIATNKPFKYHHYTSRKRCCLVLVVMWLIAIMTFMAPNFTKKNFVYYKYNTAQHICGLHWEFPAYCIITALYIPLLAGSVLIFTSYHIHKSLNAHNVRTNGNALSSVGLIQRPRPRDTRISLSRRTLHVLVATSMGYFTCWGPYVTMVVIMAASQSSSKMINPSPYIQFSAMWLANFNSMLNVFIYSSTNSHFRHAAKRILMGRSVRHCLFCQHTAGADESLVNMRDIGSQTDGNAISHDIQNTPDCAALHLDMQERSNEVHLTNNV